MSMKIPIRLLAGAGFAISLISSVMSGPALLLAGEPSSDAPTCEKFFDKWEIPGVPAMLAMGGLGSELMAAYDCVQKKDIPKACEHWTKLLAVMDKMGSPLDKSRGDVEQLMSEHKCDAAAPESESEPSSPSGPEDAE